MNNKNYRVMKFLEPVNKNDKYRGYVRLDMRGNRGNVIVAAENLGDAKSTSEVYLYKDKHNKIKLGDLNNKKGILKKMLTFGNTTAIEDYNVCAVVKDGKIVLYSNLFSTSSPDMVRKLEADDDLEPEKDREPATKILEDKEQVEATDGREEGDTKEIIEPKGLQEIRTIKQKELQKESAEETIQEVKKILQEPLKPIKVPIKKEKVEEIKAEKQESKEEAEEVKDQALSPQRYRNRFDEKLHKTLKDFKNIEPLSVKLKDFAWWYIPYDEAGIKNGILPYYNQIISAYYPYPMSSRVTTCTNLMKKYGHYIFGIYKENDEIARYIYGIPGQFTKEEQPYKGVTGFKNWSYANKESKGDYGYWLAFVNPKTGETTDPPQVQLA
jgi:hypothetical protein